MKKMVFTLICALLIAGNSWCACRALEYAEIKDMTPTELQTELAKNNKYLSFTKKMLDIKWQLRALGDNVKEEIDIYTKEATQCEDQITKIERVIQKQKQNTDTKTE